PRGGGAGLCALDGPRARLPRPGGLGAPGEPGPGGRGRGGSRRAPRGPARPDPRRGLVVAPRRARPPALPLRGGRERRRGAAFGPRNRAPRGGRPRRRGPGPARGGAASAWDG